MKLRLTGTGDECSAAIEAVGAVLTVREVSGFYPNRGASVLGRVYLDADVPAGAVQATAERGESERSRAPADPPRPRAG